MELIQCPFCGADIEQDSIYCDQCGKELNKCPECGAVCRGKFCPRHGAPAVAASTLKAIPTTNPGAPPAQPQPVTQPVTQPNPPAAPRLRCPAMGISITLKPSAIIGRVYGDYPSQLAPCQAISGTHARVECTGSQWTITDIGSRFGTMVNGRPCTPNVAVPIKKGDTIRFGQTYDFLVE